MKCKNCGTEFSEGIFCPECGTRCKETVNATTIEPRDSVEDIRQHVVTESTTAEIRQDKVVDNPATYVEQAPATMESTAFTKNKPVDSTVSDDTTESDVVGINPTWPKKSKVAAGVLGILLGGLGIHKFYLGKIGLGVLYVIFCWTYIPAIVGFIEGIIYLTMSDEKFQTKYHVRIKK